MWIISATKNLHHDSPVLACTDLPHLVTLLGQGRFKTYSIWYLGEYRSSTSKVSKTLMERVIEYPEGMGIKSEVPTGSYLGISLLHPSISTPDKQVSLYLNEIEALLDQGGLTSMEVSEAMSLLPNMDQFYAFLDTQGEWKVKDFIQGLLQY